MHFPLCTLLGAVVLLKVLSLCNKSLLFSPFQKQNPYFSGAVTIQLFEARQFSTNCLLQSPIHGLVQRQILYVWVYLIFYYTTLLLISNGVLVIYYFSTNNYITWWLKAAKTVWLPLLPGICGSGFVAELTEVVQARGLSYIRGQMVPVAGPVGDWSSQELSRRVSVHVALRPLRFHHIG